MGFRCLTQSSISNSQALGEENGFACCERDLERGVSNEREEVYNKYISRESNTECAQGLRGAVTIDCLFH